MGTLRLREDIWKAVSEHLSPPGEHFAFLRVRWSWSDGAPVLWTTGVSLIPDELVSVESGAHEVPLASMVEAVNLAVREGTALVEVHNHGGRHPRWSHLDEEGLRQVAPYMLDSLPGRPYAATVWGRGHAYGEWFGPGGRRGGLRSVTVAGAALRQLVSRDDTRESVRETWSRQLPWFTAEGQQQLGLLRVGVVGVGGTGAPLLQDLAFLGARDLVLVDPDAADRTSMNRLVTAGARDVGRSKVALASRLVRSVDPSARVRGLRRDLRHPRALEALRACDLVFGCVDNDGARLVLNELALAYQIPYIDLASGIDVSSGRVTQAGGRVACVVPGGPCLNCMGEIDQEEARFFLASAPEQEFARRRGYVRGLEEPEPSVVSLNAAVAAAAANEFSIWFSGIRAANALSELDLVGAGRGRTAQWLTPRQVRRDPNCVECTLAATGDSAGLGRFAVAARRPATRTGRGRLAAKGKAS